MLFVSNTVLKIEKIIKLIIVYQALAHEEIMKQKLAVGEFEVDTPVLVLLLK